MKLFLLTSLAMFAFAANSVLNRLALAEGAVDPASFALLRLASGSLALGVLVLLRGGHVPITGPKRGFGVASLALYMLGFSFAYVSLDAGTGALLLFGMVQVTMFAGALIAREPVPLARWIGAGVAFAGLAYLLWPTGAGDVPMGGAVVMLLAGLGWGGYSLVGRQAQDPLAATAANFLLATPLALLPLLLTLADLHISTQGILLAVTSGVLTSGLGYALWYGVLPRLPASVAAIAQLTVPVIAMAGGMVFLGEALTLRFVLASLLVLGGVGISLFRRPVLRAR